MIFSSHVTSVASAVTMALLVVASCASSRRFTNASGSATPGATSSSASSASNGKALLTLEGVASYYAHDFHGRLTSNGETYDMHGLTAAHRTFPFGTKLRVTNLENGLSVIVRINDRGPFVEGRIIDLSLGAAQAIQSVQAGTVKVRLEVLEWGRGN
jgi:rare lipoprotein A